MGVRLRPLSLSQSESLRVYILCMECANVRATSTGMGPWPTIKFKTSCGVIIQFCFRRAESEAFDPNGPKQKNGGREREIVSPGIENGEGWVEDISETE